MQNVLTFPHRCLFLNQLFFFPVDLSIHFHAFVDWKIYILSGFNLFLIGKQFDGGAWFVAWAGYSCSSVNFHFAKITSRLSCQVMNFSTLYYQYFLNLEIVTLQQTLWSTLYICYFICSTHLLPDKFSYDSHVLNHSDHLCLFVSFS